MKQISYAVTENGSVSVSEYGSVTAGENLVTALSVTFPAALDGYAKYVLLQTLHPVAVEGGGQTYTPQLSLPESGLLMLRNEIVDAEICEICFKAVSGEAVFVTPKTSFPRLAPALRSDGYSPTPLPAGLHFEGGTNIVVSDTLEYGGRNVLISLETPLSQKLPMSDVEGLEEALDGIEELLQAI